MRASTRRRAVDVRVDDMIATAGRRQKLMGAGVLRLRANGTFLEDRLKPPQAARDVSSWHRAAQKSAQSCVRSARVMRTSTGPRRQKRRRVRCYLHPTRCPVVRSRTFSRAMQLPVAWCPRADAGEIASSALREVQHGDRRLCADSAEILTNNVNRRQLSEQSGLIPEAPETGRSQSCHRTKPLSR
jgi:hypothetical protein